MGDLYSELLVKKDKTAKDSLLKYGLIVLTVLAVFAGLIITPLALIIAVALGIACYFVIPKTDVEYEYLFINGDTPFLCHLQAGTFTVNETCILSPAAHSCPSSRQSCCPKPVACPRRPLPVRRPRIPVPPAVCS